MDEGKGIGSQTHSAGLFPAGFGLARRRTGGAPQTSPPPPSAPQHQLAQAARAWQRPQNALPSVESARTPRRVRGSHKLCPSPLPTHDPSVHFNVRHMHTHPCSSFPKPSLLERRGRGSAPHMSPRVWRERFGRRGACVARSCAQHTEDVRETATCDKRAVAESNRHGLCVTHTHGQKRK